MSRSERVLITGCGGMLGLTTYQQVIEKYGKDNVLATDIDLNETWIESMDVRELTDCVSVFNDFKPTLVLHLAALTDLEYCEREQEDAWATNALGTENIALLTRQHGATLLYISTAGVFGGEKEFYTDFDTPNPLSYYAKSKYHGEQFVERYVPNYFIFRAGWMMGGGLRKDKKFINKLYKQLKSGANELFVVDDKLGTPTYTNDFARSFLKVIDTPFYGLYNQVCEGSCSRFDVAEAFLKNLDLTESVVLTRVPSDYFKLDYFAPRPASEKLVNFKLTRRNLNFMRDWETCLAEYSSEFNNDYYGT